MKKESLFLLFIVIPLCAMDSEEGHREEKKKWQLTHVIHVCDGGVADGEILCMYPRRPLSDEAEKLQPEILEQKLKDLNFQKSSVCEKCEFEKSEELIKQCEKLEELRKQENEKQNEYLDTLSYDDDILTCGLACKIGDFIYKISTQENKCTGPELWIMARGGGLPPLDTKMVKWPPRRGYSTCGNCAKGVSVICNRGPRLKKDVLEELRAIIEKREGEKVRGSLSEFFEGTKSIKSTTTYGKEGDRIAVLCSTGKVLIFVHKEENHEEPTIIYGDDYKRQIEIDKSLSIGLPFFGFGLYWLASKYFH